MTDIELTIKGSPDAINRLMRGEASVNEVRALVDLPVLNERARKTDRNGVEVHTLFEPDSGGRRFARTPEGDMVQITAAYDNGNPCLRLFDIVWR